MDKFKPFVLPSTDDVGGLSVLLQYINELHARTWNLETSLLFCTEAMTLLEKRVETLEDILSKVSKTSIDKAVTAEEKLNTYKKQFNESYPLQRSGEDFTLFEFVLWASWVVRNDPKRRDVLNSTEAFKRIKAVKKLIDNFKTIAPEKSDAEKWAKIRTKDFLEMMLLSVTQQDDEPIRFWQATSDWAFNNYRNHVATWKQVRDFDDSPA